MIAGFIKFVLSNYSLSFFLIGLVCAGISILRRGGLSRRETIYEPMLAYYCLISIGACNLYNFVMHVFFAPLSARFIGWANSPFQYEVGSVLRAGKTLSFCTAEVRAIHESDGKVLATMLSTIIIKSSEPSDAANSRPVYPPLLR